MANIPTLSNLQQELLKLYANDLPDEQLLEIRNILGQYFAQKATNLMQGFATQAGIDADTYSVWAQGHDRR